MPALSDLAREKSRIVRCARHRRRLDQFADLLAEGMHYEDAAEAVGMARKSGGPMLTELRRGLGWQAS